MNTLGTNTRRTRNGMSVYLKSIAPTVGLSLAATAALALPEYGNVWRPPSGCTKYYTSGNGHKFCVIHDMEGYYYTGISYLNRCDISASIHYAVNGLTDSTDNGAPPGEITQCVLEANYAWHALCWNTWMFGTEHEGFASNPAWFTEAMYQASAGLQRHLCETYGIPKDRNHIIAHGQKSDSAWVSWMAANYPSINATCNSHTDPGPYWDWTHFMALINGTATNTVPVIQAWDPNGTTSVGGAGTWNATAKNWTPGATQTQVASGSLVGWTNGNIALFCAGPSASTSQGTFAVNVSGPMTIGGLDNGNDNPGSCYLTLNDGGSGSLVLVANTTNTFNTGGTALGTTTLNIPITGSGALQAAFSGALTLNGTNTYSGATIIYNNGVSSQLTIGGSGSLGSGNYAGAIAIGNSGKLTYSSSAAQTLAGIVSGVGALVLNNGAAILTLTATNTHTGGITNLAGSLVVGGSGLLNSGSYAGAITNRGTFTYASSATSAQTLSGVISGPGTFVLNCPTSALPNLTLSGANTFTGKITINGGILQISSDGNLGTAPASPVANQITLNGGLTNGLRSTGTFTLNANRGITLGATGGSLHASASQTLTYGGVITGPGNFASGSGVTWGYGTVLLNGANNYSGSTTVAAGTVKLGANGTLPAGTPMTIASDQSAGSTLDLNGFSQTIGPLASSTGINGVGTRTPTLKLSGALTILQTNSTTFDGLITGSGGSLTLSSSSTGTLTLTKANSYTGNTAINGGTLEGSASGAIPGNVTNTAGVLKLSNASAMSSGATLTLAGSPAAGAVNLNFSGTQTINALCFGTSQQGSGTWGALGSGANHENAAFTGSGSLTVTTGGIIYSQINAVQSLANNGDGTFTLQMLGTPGAIYYVAASGNVTNAMAAWTPLPGSTNTAPSPSGTWTCVVSNSAPAYYRAVAINPAP